MEINVLQDLVTELSTYPLRVYFFFNRECIARNGNCIVLDMYLDLAEDLSSRPEFGTS